MKYSKMSERDLAASVVAWLIDQHWTVYQEVEFPGRGGVADIVAVRHGILWIIECKTNYSFTVLNQASRWPAHYRSVAVPKIYRGERDYRVAVDYYRVGVIEVDEDKFVFEKMRPDVFVRNAESARNMIATLTELHKSYALAGSTSGYHLTPYKQTMIAVRQVIQNNPGCTVKDLYNILGQMHYSSKKSFQGSMIKCLGSFEKDWCVIDTASTPYKLYVIAGAPACS